MTYTPNEADKAAAEKYADERTSFMQSVTEQIMWRDAHRSTFLSGIQHAKASASPAPEEWEKLRDELAEKECEAHQYRRFPYAADYNTYNTFCRGFDAASAAREAELEKARAENAAMKEAFNVARQEAREAKDIVYMHEQTMKALWGQRFFDYAIERGISRIKNKWKARREKAREALAKLEGAGEKV